VDRAETAMPNKNHSSFSKNPKYNDSKASKKIPANDTNN